MHKTIIYSCFHQGEQFMIQTTLFFFNFFRDFPLCVISFFPPVFSSMCDFTWPTCIICGLPSDSHKISLSIFSKQFLFSCAYNNVPLVLTGLLTVFLMSHLRFRGCTISSLITAPNFRTLMLKLADGEFIDGGWIPSRWMKLSFFDHCCVYGLCTLVLDCGALPSFPHTLSSCGT